MKRIIFVAIIGLYALGWLMTGQALTEKPEEYKRLLTEAERYEKNQIYSTAIEYYRQAQEIQNSLELQEKIARDYLAAGDESGFVNTCSSINEAYDYPMSTVEMLAGFYEENQRTKDLIRLLDNAIKQHGDTAELADRYALVRYTYENRYIAYGEIYPFRSDKAVCVQEGRYGLLNPDGNLSIRAVNDWIGSPSDDGLLPVFRDGKFYFADTNGNKKEVPMDDQNVEELGNLGGGVAPAKINGKYGYVNSRFEPQSEFEWDGATAMQDGFAAVRRGEKWAVVNSSFELVTDYVYEDVKTDENGFFAVSGRAFVKDANGFRMINGSGESIGEGVYEDAVLFASGEPAAVKKNGLWGFVNTDGEMVIEPQYRNAGAFSEGLAPVETENGWGYITLENEMVIGPQFSGAKNFHKGLAPVEEESSWSVIELNIK